MPLQDRRTTRFQQLMKIVVMLLLTATVARGQSALDGFDPNANGTIRVILVQSDGKILLEGDFTTLAPNGGATVTRNRIARLNPNGTLDTAFDPNANGLVYAIAVQADGKILVGGQFSGANSIGGQTRNWMARLDATTGLADSFNPNPSHPVTAITIQTDNKILVGGGFFNVGGQQRGHIARLDPTTGLADSFNPDANGSVASIVVLPDGKVLVGGEFTLLGFQVRHGIARLDGATGVPDSFDPAAFSGVIVYSIKLQADGKILVGGFFSSIGGQSRNNIARLDPTTGLADSFSPGTNGSVYSLVVQGDGKILAGGFFTGIGGRLRNRIARLDPTSGVADSFDPNANGFFVYAIAVQADGKVLAGGDFTALAPNGGTTVTRNRAARSRRICHCDEQ